MWGHNVLLFGSAASVWPYIRFGDVQQFASANVMCDELPISKDDCPPIGGKNCGQTPTAEVLGSGNLQTDERDYPLKPMSLRSADSRTSRKLDFGCKSSYPYEVYR